MNVYTAALFISLLGSSADAFGGLSFAHPRASRWTYAAQPLTTRLASNGGPFPGSRGDESADGYSSGFYQGPPKASAAAPVAATPVAAASVAAAPIASTPAAATPAAAKSAGDDRRGASPFLQKLLAKKAAARAARRSPVVAAPAVAGPNVITTLNSPKAFTEMLESNPAKIVVVKFYSHVCQACKTMAPRFTQVAQTTVAQQKTGMNAKTGEPSNSALEFVFCELEFVANRELCKSLGMGSTKLPRVHFYYGSHGKVEDFVCGPQKVRMLKQKVEAYASEGIGAFSGQPAPVFVDYSTTGISMTSAPAQRQSAAGYSSGFYTGPSEASV